MMDWLAGLGVAGVMIAHPWLYIATSAAHILGLGLLIGAILPLDLRLTGLLRRADLSVLFPFLTRAAMAGFALAAVTGTALFLVNPVEYAANPALQVKAALILLATANAAALHLTARAAGWQVAAPVPPLARASAALSIALWLSTLLAGRWIGFV
ncbi:DUF2214 domain-containing protein [Hyphomonas sp.]|uniref:DUF2214 domain-containing protein n=1 Tax=Hyphomonas sp. TaxID=87 RepID=UPI00391C0EAB